MFVAAFIGAPSMNFLEGSLEQSGTALAFRTADGVLVPIPSSRSGKLADAVGNPVVLGIRPEHTMTAVPSFPTIPVKVADVEPLGPHTLAIGTAGSAAFTAQVPAGSAIVHDDIINVPIDPEKMHFFLKSTGEAIGR